MAIRSSTSTIRRGAPTVTIRPPRRESTLKKFADPESCDARQIWIPHTGNRLLYGPVRTRLAAFTPRAKSACGVDRAGHVLRRRPDGRRARQREEGRLHANDNRRQRSAGTLSLSTSEARTWRVHD